ncbi:UNVERIFIED_CONTAM: hypothetical protein HDU68_003861, partial [Siphonaria sp. JEL0065]
FVPGFLGSSTSFASFPADVTDSVKGIGGSPPITLKMFPSFDCKGSAAAAVDSLVAFVDGEAVGCSVVLLCHSMGGLLAIDAENASSSETYKTTQQYAFNAYHVANNGAKSVYDTSAAVYNTTTKAVEKVPTGAAVVVGGTVLAAATGAAMVTAEAIATVGVVGSAAAVGVVGSAAVLGVAGVASTVVAVKKIRKVVKANSVQLSVVGGVSESENEDQGDGDVKGVQKTNVTVLEELLERAAVADESGLVEQILVRNQPDDDSMESRLAKIQERKNKLELESLERRNVIDARLLELGIDEDAPVSETETQAATQDVQFVNDLYVDESIELGVPVVGNDGVESSDTDQVPNGDTPITPSNEPPSQPTTTAILTNIFKRRPLLTTAAVTIGGSALAVGAYGAYYYSGGMISVAAPAVRSVAVGWAMTHANEASKHLKFLYPLWGESRINCEQRIQFVKDRMRDENLLFRCFYLEVRKWSRLVAES